MKTGMRSSEECKSFKVKQTTWVKWTPSMDSFITRAVLTETPFSFSLSSPPVPVIQEVEIKTLIPVKFFRSIKSDWESLSDQGIPISVVREEINQERKEVIAERGVSNDFWVTIFDPNQDKKEVEEQEE